MIQSSTRAQPGPRGGLTRLGGVFSRKRTALFWIDPGREGAERARTAPRLVWLSDLPSAGDTSYAGAVVHGDTVWVDYYTSRIDRDWPWIVGMFLASDVRMARIPLDALHARVDAEEERAP